jgi:hypothetical protein
MRTFPLVDWVLARCQAATGRVKIQWMLGPRSNDSGGALARTTESGPPEGYYRRLSDGDVSGRDRCVDDAERN